MAGLVNYDIYDDSSEEMERNDEERDGKAGEGGKNSMEDEWDDFERLIAEKAIKNDGDKRSAPINKESGPPHQASSYNSTTNDGDNRLKNLKFDVSNFAGHNQDVRYNKNGGKINSSEFQQNTQTTTNTTAINTTTTTTKTTTTTSSNIRGSTNNEAARYGESGSRGVERRPSDDLERSKRKSSRSSSRSQKYKKSSSPSKSSSSSSSSSRESKHKHHHHRHHHHKDKRRRSRSRSPRHRHHRHHHHHHRHGSSRRRSRSRSSSRSPSHSRGRGWGGSRGGGGGRMLTRAVLSSRHKRMLMMNREVSMRNQVSMVANKALDAMIAPSMKSGTKLPKVFGDMDVETLREQLKDVYGKTLDQIQLDESKLMTANEKKSALPLNDPNPFHPTNNTNTTPQQVLSQTMAAMHAKVQELTGVAIPKYYNPSAVNPLKYAEQLKKRKLLWSKNKPPAPATAAADGGAGGGGGGDEKTTPNESSTTTTTTSTNAPTTSKWVGTSFIADDGGKKTAKFNKLMGIKGQGVGCNKAPNAEFLDPEEELRRQEELFNNLETEYEMARHTTHSHRGVGLGFASHHMP